MTQHTTTNDGVRLAYEQYGDSGPVVVLIHGWSGSRKYFSRNIAEGLGNAGCRVYAYDHRFHGESDSPTYGFHVSRLAADLRDFLETLDLSEVTAVGTSMGCAVIWSYVELFGTRRLKQAVFVDQAPLQDPKPDWNLGSKGNPAQLARDMQQGAVDMAAVAAGNAESCLSLELPRDVQQLLEKETLQCDAKALGALMADHTQLDWRPVLPLLGIPCLNVVGGQSGIFPVEGCLEIARLAPDCCSAVFKKANHWLYLEQPAEFNKLLLDFVHNGNAGREKQTYVN